MAEDIPRELLIQEIAKMVQSDLELIRIGLDDNTRRLVAMGEQLSVIQGDILQLTRRVDTLAAFLERIEGHLQPPES